MSRSRRVPARVRLTLLCSGLVAATGTVLSALVYLFMRYVPTYRIPVLQPAMGIDGDPMSTPLPVPTNSIPVLPGTPDVNGDQISTPLPLLTVTSSAEFLQALLMVSALAVLILTIAGACVGWMISGRLLRPLASISAAARRAGSGDLSGRVALRGPRDEILDLSDTFDEMLDRLEGAFGMQQRFGANASHELRTPLATNRALLDAVLLSPDAGIDEYHRAAVRVRETNERSIVIVEALLDLASIGAAPPDAQPVSLDTIARDVIAQMTSEADARDLTIHADLAPVHVEGSETLIRQAALNLVTNAVRHNIDAGEIVVRVWIASDGEAHLRVQNTGAHIDPQTAARLIEPFARGSSRTSGRGHGLGLAIVDAVVSAHRSSLTLTPNPEGGITADIAFHAPVERDRITSAEQAQLTG